MRYFLLGTCFCIILKIGNFKVLQTVITNMEEHGLVGLELSIDPETGLLTPPDYPSLSVVEKNYRIRQLTIFSQWKSQYCKVNTYKFSEYTKTALYREANWCQEYQPDDKSYKNLCCGGNVCSCDRWTRYGCYCYPKRSE